MDLRDNRRWGSLSIPHILAPNLGFTATTYSATIGQNMVAEFWHKLPRTFTTLEVLVIEARFGKHDVIIMGLYRPPKVAGMDYYLRLENYLNEIITWAMTKKQFVIITGDLNLNRLKPDEREGKIPCDLEEYTT